MLEYSSMDYWFSVIVAGNRDPQLIDNMYRALEKEFPQILSVVAERSCNLRCQHCIFQDERSSHEISRINDLEGAVETMVKQMDANPAIVHEGRVFREWHLVWLKAIRNIRLDARIGIIDNGSFIRHGREIDRSGFRFDWIDISIDGPKHIHNRQRRSTTSFDEAMSGLNTARRFLRTNGRVSTLFTLTTTNHDAILETSRNIPDSVDEWHITTLSPARPEIESQTTTDEQFAIAWEQIVRVQEVRPALLRIYTVDDMVKLAKIVGAQRLIESFTKASVDLASIGIALDGVIVVFYPRSISTSETFVIDADAYYRVPYSFAYTLKELQNGVSRFGEDIRQYTVGSVHRLSGFRSLYQQGVRQWQRELGQRALTKELHAFDQIRSLM